MFSIIFFALFFLALEKKGYQLRIILNRKHLLQDASHYIWGKKSEPLIEAIMYAPTCQKVEQQTSKTASHQPRISKHCKESDRYCKINK